MTLWKLFAGATALAALLTGLAFGQERAAPLNAKGGLAVRGYDVVAYFTDGKPVQGNPGFQHEWMGAKWQFASAAQREAFAKEPAKYAPQFGGYCAWAVSQNYTYDADPEIWRIVAGKLYLNYNRLARFQWERDVPGNISKGNQHWPKLHK